MLKATQVHKVKTFLKYVFIHLIKTDVLYTW